MKALKEGKDQGIDLRYSLNNKNSIIVQCKRFTSITDLRNNLKQEVTKVKKLNPKRYILMTSVNLSPKQKNDIKEIFKGVRLYLKDILGKKDINNLLGKYPDIEKNHYKLWLNSTAVMQKILHSTIYNRSDFEQDEIEREIKIYVSNDSNREATDILNENNYVIISGIPGIGKTTLAKMLIYNFLLSDWKLVSVSNDINEAEESIEHDTKQVFYYDDFLGTNLLASYLPKNEDKRLIKFIEQVKKTKNKKLILTTREYILNQAKEKFELFNNESLEIGKCTIDLKKYTKLIKGKILYNHLFFSDLNYSFLSELIKDNRFLRIINHRNYNPRLIQYLTDRNFIKSLHSNQYYNFFIENLENPEKVWNYAYNSHISSISRYLLIVLLNLGDPVFKEDLYDALISFFQNGVSNNNFIINQIEFNKSLRECEKTFITIERDIHNQIIIKFQNPSIKDFLLNYLKNNDELITDLINSSIFFNQFFEIYSIWKGYPFEFYDEQIQHLLFSRLEKNFFTMPLSALSREIDLNKFEFYYSKANLTNLQRLDKFVTLFDLNLYEEAFRFLYDEFLKIDIDEEVYGDTGLYYYLNIIEKINDHKKLDGKVIITKLFSHGKIKNFEDIKETYRIKDIFPDEYEDFRQNNKFERDEVIESVLSNEYNDLENDFDKRKIEEFIEEINTLESEFDYSVHSYEMKANDLMINIEDKKEEKKLEIESLSTPLPSSIDDDNILINIFNSLKFKQDINKIKTIDN